MFGEYQIKNYYYYYYRGTGGTQSRSVCAKLPNFDRVLDKSPILKGKIHENVQLLILAKGGVRFNIITSNEL